MKVRPPRFLYLPHVDEVRKVISIILQEAEYGRRAATTPAEGMPVAVGTAASSYAIKRLTNRSASQPSQDNRQTWLRA